MRTRHVSSRNLMATDKLPVNYLPSRQRLKSGEAPTIQNVDVVDPARFIAAEFAVVNEPEVFLPLSDPFQLLVNRFELPPEGNTLRLLMTRPDIVAMFLLSVEPIEAHFGVGTPISLTAISDPENNSRPVLVAMIHTSKQVSDGVQSLNEFKKTWWYSRRRQFRGEANFNISFD